MADIQRYGQDEAVTWRWVRAYLPWGGGEACQLIAIDRFGEVVRRTGRIKPLVPGTPSEEEAVTEILGPALDQADSDLERRRRDAPEPEPEPPPMDPATRRFLQVN